jgi:hypothetical protein
VVGLSVRCRGARALAVAALLVGRPLTVSAQFTLQAVATQTPPVVDGVIADGEWNGAPVATGFVQFEPRRGEPSPYRTEARILYDRQHIYVSFRAWDPEPLTAQLTQRDAALDRDDAVGVLIDTFGDRQTAYFFAVNVLSTQADARIADDGRTVDFNWDAPWRAAARRTPDGWTAELSLPLASMKYSAGDNRAWGINFVRSRRRTLELSHWAGPVEHQYRVSQSGRLTGLTVAAPERRQQVIPYALSRVQQSEATDWDMGIDARYALTPQLSMYGTLFPDFATVEADQETINLTRFEVQLPEKRQFFLEGNELFGQRIRSFYSRRIADIAGGAKLLGRQGPWTVAALSVLSEPLTLDERASYTVARAQRALFGRSTVAVTGASRHLDGLNEGSVGIDTTLLFGRTFNFTGQWLASHGRYGSGTIAWFVRPSYDSPTGHFHVRYTHLGDRVADNINAIGQVRDDDRRELDSAVNKTLWIRGSTVERVRYDSNYNAYWAQKSDTLRSWQIDEGVAVDLRNRISAEVDYTEEYKLFEKDFRNRRIALTLGYNTREYQSVSAGYEFGRNFDADYTLWRGSARRKLGDATSVEYELQRVRFTPDPEESSTVIHVVRGSHFFTTDLFLRVFYQTNSAIDRRNVQATFVYRYLPPFGTLQLVYQRGTAEFGQPSDQGHTLFVKATTVF